MPNTGTTFAKPIKFISAVWHLSSKEKGKKLPVFDVSVSDAGQISVGTREDSHIGARGPGSSSQRPQRACQWGRPLESCCKEIRNLLVQP